MEKIVKKYVDCLLAFEEVLNDMKELKEQDIVPFFQAVAEEMRNRGINEERINNALKGALWGQTRLDKIETEIKGSPSILDEG